MTLQEEIRTDLQVEVFDVFGKTVTFINKSTPIYNSWGEIESYTNTQSTVVVVPYDILWDKRSQQPFGQLSESEMAMAVPYTLTVKKDDQFLIEGDYFKVNEVNKNWLPDNVVTILKLSRIENIASDDSIPTS